MRFASPAVLTALFVAGCNAAPKQPSPDDETTCPEGEITDGTACVPEACGEAPWGPAADATTFVDASASPDGDGSKEAPFRSLTEALAAGSDIAIAAGTYVENVTLTGNVDGLRIRGRCAAMVTLDGSEGAADARTFSATGRGTVRLEGVTVTGGPNCGVEVSGGTLAASGIVVTGNTACGAIADVSGTLTLAWSTLADNRMTEKNGYGRGVMVLAHSSATITHTVVSANQHVGVYASGVAAQLTLDMVNISGTRADAGDPNGFGLEVLDGATANVTNTHITDSVGAGVIADGDGTVVSIADSTISGTQPGESSGRGVVAQGGAAVSLTRTTLAGNATLGATSAGTATRLTLTDVDITGVPATPGATSGYGVEVARGGSAIVVDSSILDAFGAGVLADGTGTVVDLDVTFIGQTQTLPDGTGGMGIVVQNGAAATLQDCYIESSHSVGLLATGTGTSVRMTAGGIGPTFGARALGGGGAPDGLGRGIEVSGGASFESHGVRVAENRECGIIASGAGTTVTLDADEIWQTARGNANGYAVGIIAQLDASIVASSLSTHDNAGPGMTVAQGGSFSCTACTVERNTFAGVVGDAGRIELVGGSVRNTGSDATGGGGVGIYSTPAAGSVVTVDGVAIAGQPLASVWFSGPGAFVVQRSELDAGYGTELRPGLTAHGNAVYAGSGIRAWDGETGLLLNEDTLSSGPGPVVLLDGAGVETIGNTWEGASTSIVQQACGDTPPTLLADDAPTVDICPAADQVVLPMVFSIELTETAALSE